MENSRIIVEEARFQITIERLCRQLIERHGNFENSCLIGIQPKGVYLADRILDQLKVMLPEVPVLYGKLDITFYRDDFRRREKPIVPSKMEMDFLVEGKKVVLIDDVLYSGRTTSAALTAINNFGRPDMVELLVLVDRRFNRQLPIKSDYIGFTVDALDQAYVRVQWREQTGKDQIILFADKNFK